MLEVKIVPQPLEALAAVLTPEQADRFRAAATHARTALSGRVVWNVSSTAGGARCR